MLKAPKDPLFEFVVVSGIGKDLEKALIPNSSENLDLKELLFQPEILFLEPENTKTIPSLPVFIQPQRGIKFRTSPQPQNSYQFILTSDQGKRLWGFVVISSYQISEKKHLQLEQLLRSTKSQASIPDKVFAQRTICIVSDKPYHQTFQNILNYFVSQYPQNVKFNKAILNRLSTILQNPVESKLRISPPTIIINKKPFKLPEKAGLDSLPTQDIDFEPLFSRLSPKNVIKFFTALLTERKTIVISKDLTLLNTCITAILSLLYPLRWRYILVSPVPFILNEIFDAPSIFLFGSIYTALNINLIQPEIVIIDIDTNYITSHEPLVELPPRLKKKLKNILHKNSNLFKQPFESLQKSPIAKCPEIKSKKQKIEYECTSFSSSEEEHEYREIEMNTENLSSFQKQNSEHEHGNGKGNKNNKKQKKIFNIESIQKGFVSILTNLFKKYNRHFLEPTEKHQFPRFDRDSFLKDISEDCVPFMTHFTETQLWVSFYEDHLLQNDLSIHYFDQILEEKLKRKALRLQINSNPYKSGILKFYTGKSRWKSWKERYFVLSNGKLIEFTKESKEGKKTKKSVIKLIKGKTKIKIPSNNIMNCIGNQDKKNDNLTSSNDNSFQFNLIVPNKYNKSQEIISWKEYQFCAANEGARRNWVYNLKMSCVSEEMIEYLSNFQPFVMETTNNFKIEVQRKRIQRNVELYLKKIQEKLKKTFLWENPLTMSIHNMDEPKWYSSDLSSNSDSWEEVSYENSDNDLDLKKEFKKSKTKNCEDNSEQENN
ncbi:denn domain-containing protein [Anaeramoeba flamelloides]|uniref:Denn domain-containing protein n=1 Tax=Anaeramoeba flamelloides TaxID=1746091 RepID=A0ABQ8X4A4_9EUKA|nr:denn domain-containing protein [Anaeramoeba flamelloides]